MRRAAITVPTDLLAAIDRIAQERHESRSRFVTQVLRAAVRARKDAAITRRLDELFSSPRVSEDQIRGAEDLDSAGTHWADELW